MSGTGRRLVSSVKLPDIDRCGATLDGKLKPLDWRYSPRQPE